MKAGEVVQMSDLEPISIPFGGGKRGSNSTPAEEAGKDSSTETVTPDKAERVWVTQGEVDRYIGKPLVEDVESGDQLVHKLLDAASEFPP